MCPAAAILRTGICDALSALRLGVQPTGNGKRESFSHKVYTRMTNTVFDSGSSTLEEMIASIRKGYLLEGTQSGMEDPKHWGIQCIVCRGYEIRDGALTGRVVAPVVMTGYVPDLLGGISMRSRDRVVEGSGHIMYSFTKPSVEVKFLIVPFLEITESPVVVPT